MSKEPLRPIDIFYLNHGKPCCAGCDWWRPHNAVAGECTRSAPVSGEQRAAMLGMENCSLSIGAGHVLTKRDHSCGDFIDTYDWGDAGENLPHRKENKPPFCCAFCGAPSWLDPSEQSAPVDYCHPEDHGNQEDYESSEE